MQQSDPFRGRKKNNTARCRLLYLWEQYKNQIDFMAEIKKYSTSFIQVLNHIGIYGRHLCVFRECCFGSKIERAARGVFGKV